MVLKLIMVMVSREPELLTLSHSGEAGGDLSSDLVADLHED